MVTSVPDCGAPIGYTSDQTLAQTALSGMIRRELYPIGTTCELQDRLSARRGLDMGSYLIGEFVRLRRKEAGLTQAELAAKAGVGLRFIRELEQGKESLRTDTVNKVLVLFGKRLGPVDMQRE